MVDQEKLITLVFERKPLWDTGDKTYHNRDVSRKLWSEIAAEIGCTNQLVKTKWQGLRDNFRREYLKHSKATTVDGVSGKSTSHWRYYKLLIFLTDVFATSKMEANLPRPDTDTTSSQDLEREDDHQIDSDYEESSSVSGTVSGNKDTAQATLMQTTSQAGSSSIIGQAIKKRKTDKKEGISKLVALEEKKLLHFQQLREGKGHTTIHEDEDYHFLMSLLPHLQDIPKTRKLAVRLKLQQVLMEEENEKSLNAHGPFSSTSNSNSMSQTPSPSSFEMKTIDKEHSFFRRH